MKPRRNKMGFYIETKDKKRVAFQNGKLGEVGPRSTKALVFESEEDAAKFIEEKQLDARMMSIVSVTPKEEEKKEEEEKPEEKDAEKKEEIKKAVRYVTAANGKDLVEA